MTDNKESALLRSSLVARTREELKRLDQKTSSNVKRFKNTANREKLKGQVKAERKLRQTKRKFASSD